MIEDILEICIITWNRKDFLQNTLNYVFAEDSPIKNCSITVFDNKSTDGTSELVQAYCAKHSNLKHVINKYNIGGNPNIIRAMEHMSKKYFWILCDDDDFNWENWPEIEMAMEQDYDAIMLEWKQEIPKKDPEPFMLNNMAFLPSTIYKTENLTDTVITNAYSNVMYSLPHLMLSVELINKNKRIFVASKKIIEAGVHKHFSIKDNSDYHFRASHFELFVGFISSYQMIKDKKIRKKCCACLCQGRSLWYSLMFYFKSCKKFYPYNVSDLFLGLSFSQRIIFILAFINYITIYKIIAFRKTQSHIDIILLGTMKTHLFRHNNLKAST